MCVTFCCKEPIFEPFSRRKVLRLDFDAMTQVAELLKYIEYDAIISHIVELVCESANANSNKFTRDQKVETARRMQEIVNEKFPSSRGIVHQGYSIYCRCSLFQLQRKSESDWEGLVNEASQIPNTADRAYVLGKIASCMPNRMRSRRDEVLEKVGEEAASLPTTYDKVQSMQNLANVYEQFDRSKCETILRNAMLATCSGDSDSIAKLRRSLVDLAHRLDPDLANDLVSSLDNDPARIEARLELDEELRILNAARTLHTTTFEGDSSRKPRPGFRSEKQRKKSTGVPDNRILPQLAWRALADLNAERGIAPSFATLVSYVVQSSTLPLSNAFPVMNWILSCAARLYGNTDQAVSIARPLFESTLVSCTLCERMIARSAGADLGASLPVNQSDGTSLIGVGQKEVALEEIRRWMHEEVDDYLLICDPYFEVYDLEILRFVLETGRDVAVTWISDYKMQSQDPQISDKLSSHWRSISSVSPPETDIVLMQTAKTKVFPMHDRWWITKGGGLRIGTSLNGLGVRRISEISRLSADAARTIELNLRGFVSRRVQRHIGERINFVSFPLV